MNYVTLYIRKMLLPFSDVVYKKDVYLSRVPNIGDLLKFRVKGDVVLRLRVKDIEHDYTVPYKYNSNTYHINIYLYPLDYNLRNLISLEAILDFGFTEIAE